MSSPVSTATSERSLVRVTVHHGAERVDLAVPALVPLADLLPELAGGLLAGAAPAGLAVVTLAGARLAPEEGLRAQSVVDGAVLVLVDGDEAPPRHDDPAEALGEAVERRVPLWRPAAARATATGATALLLALSAAGLAWAGGAAAGPARAAGAAAVVLGCAGVLLSRAGATDPARLLAWAAVVHAAVAGALVAMQAGDGAGGPAGGGVSPAAVVAAGGAAALGAALAGMVGLAGDRVALLPAAVLGLSGLVVGWLLRAAPEAAGTIVAGGVVAAAVGGGLAPRVALGLAGLRGSWAPGDAERPPAAPFEPATPGLAPGAAEAEALLGIRLVVALELALGLLLVALCGPVAAVGPAGAPLALCCGAVVALRSRRHRALAPLLVCLGCGTAATVVSTGVLLAAYPEARTPLGGALAVAGLLVAARPRRGSLGWHRAADLAEWGCVVALLPLLAATAGVPGLVADAIASATS